MTLAPTAPFTSREGGVDRTMMGGGMDMTLAPTIATDRTMMGGGMDMTLAPTTPATSKDRTMIGGGMDMTLAQQLDLETTGDYIQIRSCSFVCLPYLCLSSIPCA